MVIPDYKLFDEVEMKKAHPCGSKNRRFQIIRIGADVKIKCLACGNVIMLDRADFNTKIKLVICSHDKII